jgi:hypothetical protein
MFVKFQSAETGQDIFINALHVQAVEQILRQQTGILCCDRGFEVRGNPIDAMQKLEDALDQISFRDIITAIQNKDFEAEKARQLAAGS